MEIETPAAPVEGVVEETTLQATLPPEQGAEPQTTPTDKVESAEPSTTSPSETRKPSDYYKDRDRYKKRVDTLESTIQTLQEQMASIKNSKPVPEADRPKLKFDVDRFYTNPQEVLQEVLESEKAKWREEVRKELLENELPRVISETHTKTEFARRQQDAMEMIFPKNGIDDRRSLKERSEADPERLKKLDELWLETGMDVLWDVSPEKAVANFLKLTKDFQPQKKNPNVISKGLVGSTATGRPAGGRTMPTLSEIKSQLKTLDDQVESNSDIRNDPKWKEQRETLKNQLSVLYKELGNSK